MQFVSCSAQSQLQCKANHHKRMLVDGGETTSSWPRGARDQPGTRVRANSVFLLHIKNLVRKSPDDRNLFKQVEQDTQRELQRAVSCCKQRSIDVAC